MASTPESATETPAIPASSTVTEPTMVAVRMYVPAKSTTTVCPSAAMFVDPDVSANSASEGKPLIVTVYAPPSTLAKEYAPPPTVAVVAPLLSDTATPSRPAPSRGDKFLTIEPTNGGTDRFVARGRECGERQGREGQDAGLCEVGPCRLPRNVTPSPCRPARNARPSLRADVVR